jgi:TRAP-type C4-dicarboxylate transport system substrate-binding protein
MAFNRSFNTEEQARLKKLIDEGMQVTYEIENLKEGLRDTVKAIAEEMDLKPGVLNKAIRIAHKASFQDE